MKIVDSRNYKYIKFKNLPHGDTFMFNQETYIKILKTEIVVDSDIILDITGREHGSNINCIDLKTGLRTYCDPDMVVQQVKCIVNITE